jgi:hypothetical protein
VNSKEITIFARDDFEIPSNANNLILFINEQIEKIPEDLRHTANINVESSGDEFDVHLLDVKVSYFRPKTEEELQQEKDAAERAEKIAIEERKYALKVVEEISNSLNKANEELNKDLQSTESKRSARDIIADVEMNTLKLTNTVRGKL